MSPAAGRLAAVLVEQAGRHDQGVRRVVAALRRNPDQLAAELDHLANLVDALGADQAARVILAGRRR